MAAYLGYRYGCNGTSGHGLNIFRRDGTSIAFLQGDEASEVLASLEWIDKQRYPRGPFRSHREHIDALLDAYDYQTEEK